VIVGFPGETEDDVQQLLDFLEDVQLDRVGVFTYSPQEGTRAFDLPDDVPDEIKRERLERVSEVQRLVTAERYEREVGRIVQAIVDRVDDSQAQARTTAQADDIDGVTFVRREASNGDALAPGDLVDVRLDAVVNDCDFEATLVRHISTGQVAKPEQVPRVLPVMSTMSAFGR
jgi:ribosomal protein S12 methylthiotransferase